MMRYFWAYQSYGVSLQFSVKDTGVLYNKIVNVFCYFLFLLTEGAVFQFFKK